MAARSVMYVGTLLDGGVADAYGIEEYSLAGENKKRNVVSALQRESTVTVVSPTFDNEGLTTFRRGGTFHDEDLDVPVYVPPAIGVFGLSYFVIALTTAAVLLSRVHEDQPDTLVFYNLQLPTVLPAMAARVVSNVSVILEYEDGMFSDPETRGVVRTLSKWSHRVFGDRIDGAICASKPLADRLSTENTVVFRGFPSVGMPDELPPGPDNGPPTVMFAGRFDGVRGIETFLDVAPLVAERTDDVRFWVSGYGEDAVCRRIERRVNELPCDIRYLGTLPWQEYRSHVGGADVHVNLQNPSPTISQYTFPSKLLDFMSAGGTIVSTDMGDLRAVFENELVFTEYDHEEIADTIATCLETDTPTTSGERAREWIEKHCDRSRVGEQITKVVDRAA